MNMLFLLGSGMMERPYFWYSLLYLALMVVFCLLFMKAVDRSERKGWRVVMWFSVPASIVCLLLFVMSFDKDSDKEQKMRSPIKEFVYNNHEYLVWRNRSIVHNPNCRCRKVTINDSVPNHTWETVIHDNVIEVYDRFE